MNIDYTYVKRRSEFGSTCYYLDDGPFIDDCLYPNKALSENYVIKNPVNKATQEGPVMSLNEINTWRADYNDRGMFHDQGGWPKDLNIADEEAVLRYRKKLEREDNYVASMKFLTKPIEHAILQNNAINIYESYFSDVMKEYSVSESLTQMRNLYKDPKSGEGVRPVSSLSWSPERASMFAASYCNTNYYISDNFESTEAYIWNVENPNVPQTVFDSKIPIVNLQWNPMDSNILAGGLKNGRIAVYDLRRPPEHVDITSDVVSHRDSVHSVLWIYSKTGADFFTTSADGVIKWWDYRHLKTFTDSIILDVSKSQNIIRAYGASCLDFDSSIPAKYLVGTETGHVICGNRKGMTLSEKLPWMMKAHGGPIYKIMRNPAFSKMFLTAAEWNVRIWSEDCRDSPAIWIKNYKSKVTSAEWSKVRYSVFCTTRDDGVLDVWDILVNQKQAHASIKVSQEPLKALTIEEHGQYLVTGDDLGKCYLICLGESLSTCAKNDKVFLSAMFERENRREKILEGRTKEIKLALKLKAQQAEEAKDIAVSPKNDLTAKLEEVSKAEADYWEEVEKVLGVYSDSTKKKDGKEEKKEKQEEVAPEQVLPQETQEPEAAPEVPPET